jgi:mannosyltransferase OCH1-like enzyme
MINMRNIIYKKSREEEQKLIELNKTLAIPYPIKTNYSTIIPANIFQTWYTKKLPPLMAQTIFEIKRLNPKFNHYLFDDNDCREFIKTHFKPDVLNAYDRLIPGAYKADLWRLCILFIKGGIYLDIKLACINGFKLIELTEEEHFVKDRPSNSIYNALMACLPGNIFLFKCIIQIVENVKNNFYGECPLSPTGPKMIGSVIVNNKLGANIDMIHYEGGGYIIYKNRFVISTEYPEYENERKSQYNIKNTKRYDKLWENKTIYK